MDNIKISVEELVQKKDRAIKLGSLMVEQTDAIKAEVEAIPDIWKSSAADTVMNKLRLICSELYKSLEEISKHSGFLEITASAYEAAEAANRSAFEG